MVFFNWGLCLSPECTLRNGGGNFLVSWKVLFYYRNRKRELKAGGNILRMGSDPKRGKKSMKSHNGVLSSNSTSASV